VILGIHSTSGAQGSRAAAVDRSAPLRWILAAPLLTGLALAVCCGTPASAGGEERWLLLGTADTELWRTDADSFLLSRDRGNTAPGGDLRLWFAADPHERLRLIAVGRIVGGTAHGADGTTSNLEQAYLRFTAGSRRKIFLEAGRLPNWLGNASGRYLPRINPLVGRPFGHTQTFPLGVSVSGAAGRFDYRVGAVDGPRIDERFLPTPGSRWRPAAAFGITPFRGLRVGLYATRGSYLSRDHQAALPSNRHWTDYEQQVTGLELQFTRRYIEVNADHSRSHHDTPTDDARLHGSSTFIELKYVLRPRWFAALRASRNSQIQILSPDPSTLNATVIRFDDLELGGGYRITPNTLLKLAYRQTTSNGHALTTQLTHTFNLRPLLPTAHEPRE